MPRTKRKQYKERFDPYDPRTGATGNDDPNESEADVDADGDAEIGKKRGRPLEPSAEHAGERSSPGSGEDEIGGAADIQPDDVEQDEPAR